MRTIGYLTSVLLAAAVGVSAAAPPDDASRSEPGSERDIADRMMAAALARARATEPGAPAPAVRADDPDAGPQDDPPRAKKKEGQPEPKRKTAKPPARKARRQPSDSRDKSSDRKTRKGRKEPSPADKRPAKPQEQRRPARSLQEARDEMRGSIDIGQVQLSGSDIIIESVGTGLLIYGQPEDVAILQRMIEQLDEEIPERELQILTLENKKASEVAQGVQQIVRDLYEREAPERPHDRVTVSALSTNIILIAAPESKMDEVITIIKSIDAVPEALPEFELMTFDIKHRKPSEAAAKLEEIINSIREKQGAEAGPEFKIVPYDDTGKITVLGPLDQKDKIQQLLDQVDAEPKEGFGEVKLVLFPLINNRANDMADTLEELLVVAETREEAAEAIRRLRMIKMKDGEAVEELPPVDLEKPLKIIPDQGTQSIIVATVEANINPIGELIGLLDGVPLAQEVGLQIFNLRYADAESVKDLLEDLFQAGKDLPKPVAGTRDAVPDSVVGEALVYEIAISADLRTNTLIVSGRPAQTALAAKIVIELDQPSTAIKFPLQLIPLEHSSAARLGKVIDELFTKRIESLEKRKAGNSAIERERVFVTMDERTNALVLSASPENYAEILRIIEKLDTPAEKLFENIRIINCANTSAADLAGKIEDLWKRKADLRREAELPEDLPILVADQRSNSLVIAASPEDFEEIKTLVDRLEAQPLAPIAEIRLVSLVHNDATEVADMLEQLFEERMQQRLVQGQEEDPSDRVALATDASTNIILVASSKANYDEMLRIIRAIDVEPDLEGVVRVFFLRHAVAKDVAERIEELFSQGIYHPQKGLESQLVEERQKVAMVDDPRSNSVIVSASKTNLAIIEQLIRQMDSDEPLMLQAETELFQLRYADAVQIADMMETMFEGIRSSAAEPDLFPEPTIIADERSNTLIVTGTRDALKRCENLLEIVDAEAGPPTATFEIYALVHASAARLGPKMQEMFDKRDEGRDQKRSPIFIQADEGTNSLICTASRDDHLLITGLLRLLDKPSNISKQVEIFPLKAAKAEALADRLEALFRSQAQTGGGVDRADVLAVEPDRRTNSLIVWAAPSEMENIAHIIHKLDTTTPGPEMMVKVIRLNRALAEDFAQVLDDTINEEGGGDEQAAIIKFEETLPDGTTRLRTLLRQDITITPDAKSNALMVMAPLGSIEMLESLITAFDRLPPTLAEIRLFQLSNADAEEVVEKLDAIFEEPGGEELEQQLTIGEGGAVSITGAEGGLGGLRLPLRFTADRRTNTVIAAGHEIDLRMVETFVHMLDIPDVEERITEVYKANYIPAEDIANAVTSFADQERDRLSDIETETAAMRRAERHVTAIHDEDSNSLLLGVSPRYYSHYMNMIHQLDRPPPQVMIQVLIAEVTLTDSLGIGFEFAAQDLNFTENAVVGPNGTIQGADFDYVGGTDVGAASVGGALGGFSFSITGEDFNFLFKALQSDGMVEVLSRPTILVENNEEANITIGNQVPIVQGVSTSTAGQLSSQITYENVGIILDVVPHINPDGFVNLEVKPEISSLSPSSVQISEGFTAPIISERSAETVVTVKDGETVVIGGLIDTMEQQSETRVPLLGDVPGIGALFRATNVESRRTELLIVLTVNVVRSEDDAYAMSVKMRDGAGIITPKIKRSPLMEGLRILPEEEEGLGPVDDDVVPIAPGRDEVQPDRQLYGPNPDVYGPQVPRRVQISRTPAKEAKQVYGPALVSHPSP